MNWGNRLLITFIVFGSGMIYLVYRSMHTNFELVEKEYYKSELVYQDVIDARKNTERLSTSLQITVDEVKVGFVFPSEINARAIEGDVWFYCAYDEKLDRKFTLKPSGDGEYFISKKLIAAGNYQAKINCKSAGKNYYFEEHISIK